VKLSTEHLTHADRAELYEIWEKHYADEFAFPDFFKHFLCAFKVLDDSGKIITAGGIRTILEMVLVTDKDLPKLNRVRALRNALDFSKHIAFRHYYEHIHATVQDDKWEKQLKKYQFEDAVGKFLVLKEF
jgi:hypothetical protein